MPFFWFILFCLGTLSTFFFLFPAWRNWLASLQTCQYRYDELLFEASVLPLYDIHAKPAKSEYTAYVFVKKKKKTWIHPIHTVNASTIRKWLNLLFCHVMSITDPLNEISISTDIDPVHQIRASLLLCEKPMFSLDRSREKKIKTQTA